MDSSFMGRESVVDLGSIIADLSHANDDNSAKIPVKKLAGDFENCATKAEDGMKVYLRVRPCNKPESTISVETDTTIITNAPESSKRALYTKTEARHYMFSRVFDANSQQNKVFDHTTGPLLQRFFDGENSVVFAYGMTNAGKTYTIQGTSQNPGILPRLVSRILDHVAMHNDWELHISMLEVYQENIFDLLGKKREKLSIRDGFGKVEVAKLSSHPVLSTQDSFRLMDIAASKRSKSSTFLNTGSSRSHAVYTLTLARPDGRGDMYSTAFQLVDLAGAERGNRTKATLTQQKEANNINTSLMQLWRCLQAVKRKNNDLNGTNVGEMIPFRESKLTHLLMPILGRAGLSGVAMIACVNPAVDDYDETLTVLGNASLASKIREFVDVGRTAAQHVLQSAMAPPAPVVHAPPAPVQKSIKVEDLKEFKDKQSSASSSSSSVAPLASVTAAAGSKRKRTPHETNISHNGIAKKTTASSQANTKSKAVSIGSLASVAETVITMSSNEDDGAVDGEDGSERKRLRREVFHLQEMNQHLMQANVQREAEIRNEVSQEMMSRSSELLDQLQQLREELAEKEAANFNDVTKSVRKAKKQQMQSHDADTAHALREAEEELERVKAEHEIEVFKLRSENFRLREELARYKPMSTVLPAATKKALNNMYNDENSVVVSSATKTGSGVEKKSPYRSPLSPLNNRNSPLVQNGHNGNVSRSNSPLKVVPAASFVEIPQQENRSAKIASSGSNLSPQQRLRNYAPSNSSQSQSANGHHHPIKLQTVQADDVPTVGSVPYFTRLRSQFAR